MTVAPSLIDLTTLAAVKAWAKVVGSTDDDLLQRLVTQISASMLRQINRSTFYGRTVTARVDSYGGSRLMMPDFPVTSLSALSIGSAVIPAAPTPAAPAGYLLAPWDGIPPGGVQAIDLFGYGFPKGPQGVTLTYRAGYETIGEAATVPASTSYVVAPAATQGPAMVDSGVTLAGVAMTKVASTPASGQYSFTQDGTTGLWSYTFNAAQSSAAVLLSYSWVPYDVFHAAAEWCSERYKYRDRQGETTRSVAGQQTAGYDTAGVPKFVKEILDQYVAVGPLF